MQSHRVASASEKFSTPRSPRNLAEMPFEILSYIVSLATADEEHDRHEISYVCRVFHAHSQSQLFKEISLKGKCHATTLIAPANRRVQNLYALIVADPEIGKHCRKLAFKIQLLNNPCNRVYEPLLPDDFALATSLLDLLPNIQYLEVAHGFGHQHTWPFLRAALHSKQFLETVKFTCIPLELDEQLGRDMFLPDVVKCIDGLHLQRLELGGVRLREPDTWSLQRKSTLRTLVLIEFYEDQQTLGALLSLPIALKHFSLDVHNNSRKSAVWSLEKIQALLDIQRESLEVISISTLNPFDARHPSKFGKFNVREYPRLKQLSISRYDMFGETLTPEFASHVLLAPNLEHLVWDFTDYGGTDWYVFGVGQRDFITEFGNLAIAQGSKLRIIEIIFTPNFAWHERQDIYDQVEDCWPWDLMDEAKAALSPYIELTYNKFRTREECIAHADAMESDELDDSPEETSSDEEEYPFRGFMDELYS